MEVKQEKIKEFKDIIKDNKYKEILLNGNLSDIEVYKAAIWLGYLDACRTFNKDQSKIKFEDKTIEKLAKEIKNYIKGDNEFKHENLCNVLDYEQIKFGQKQKIVNMAFKYLFCIADTPDVKRKFDSCHMPLDSIMLEWIYENINDYNGEHLIRSKIGPWSNMKYGSNTEKDNENEYTYCYYQGLLNEYCEKNGVKQLQLDFDHWRETAQNMAVNSYLKNFSDTEKNDGLPIKLIHEHPEFRA